MKRFWDKVNKSNDCWEWTAGKLNGGHGSFKLDGKTVAAHRVAYELCVGKIPNGVVIRHDCDNPPCCNPDHLSPGSQLENMKDKVDRGRAASGNQRAASLKRSKLTMIDVKFIRHWLKSYTQKSIAEVFGVTHQAISNISRGRSWCQEYDYE